MAFPRINALSFWLLPVGGLTIMSGFVAKGGAACGLTCYSPLNEQLGTGVDLWLAGLILVGTASILGAINFIVTILRMRTPGMTMMRVPVFVWSILATSLLVILAAPVLTAGLIMLFADRRLGTSFFDPAHGGVALLWQNVFWFFGHPEVYMLILGAWGVVTEILSVFSGEPIFSYRGGVPRDGLRHPRHLLGRGAPPLRPVRGHALRDHGGHVLLVPQDIRQDALPEARPVALLVAVHRVQRDVLPHAHPGPSGDAPEDRRLRARSRLELLEPRGHDRCLLHRHVTGDLPGERDHHAQEAQDRPTRPVEGQHARMGDVVAAPTTQLRRPSSDPLQPARVRPAAGRRAAHGSGVGMSAAEVTDERVV